jgi:hypothetical protein
MGEIPIQQVYDLALEIDTHLGELESSLDELLIEMRIENRAMEFHEASRKVSRAFSQ